MSGILKYFDKNLPRRFARKIIPNMFKILTSPVIRICGCCGKVSLFLQFGQSIYNYSCIQCAAINRYEALGKYIRNNLTLNEMDVLELDPNSPLRPLLGSSRTYVRSYFDLEGMPGAVRSDRAVLEDITRLTLKDSSIDLIVSSDVLEHVPDLSAAFSETYRVLRPGGSHVFTVPTHDQTIKLAEIRNGSLVQIVEPAEYHSDPLNKNGILAYWHIGRDLEKYFKDSGLDFTFHETIDDIGRVAVVWVATKPG